MQYIRYLVTILVLALPLQDAYLTLIYEDDWQGNYISVQNPGELSTLLSSGYIGKFNKVVLDAGHGGKDHGCTANSQREKEIVLDIVLMLGRLIEKNHADIEVIYTRKTDVFIPLYKRIRIANEAKADLFISVHCNYSEFPNVKGSETYVMGLHSAVENLNVAKRENASVLLEADFEKNYDGYDPNSPAGHIILSMYQNAFLEQSINMAQKVEYEFNMEPGIKSRGVKQAGFVVLKKATMPSVLVEAGYLSNVEEAARLGSYDGKKKVARQIYKAFVNYVKEIENKKSDHITYKTTPPRSVRKEENTEAKFKDLDPKSLKENNHLPKVTFSKQYRTEEAKETSIGKPPMTHHLRYRVQIAASKGKPLNKSGMKWRNLSDLEMKVEDGMYKYLVGNLARLEEALDLQTEMRSRGFNGAFVVAYDGELRIGLKKAREISSSKNNF